jgi:four helix bundle protein
VAVVGQRESSDKLKSYRQLIVWQRSFALANRLYEVTGSYPRTQLYGLVSQIQRAAVSIPSNIAEGYNRNSRKEYIRYLSIALGSVAELETQLLLSQEQGYITPTIAAPLLAELDELGKMLRAMQQKLAPKP